MLRLLRALLAGALALYAAYLIGANIFLSTGLWDRTVNGAPDTIWIGFQRGWTLFPGRIHVEGLKIRGRDSMVEWLLQIDRVDFTVSFLGAFRHQFKCTSVDADGLSFRLRVRLKEPPTQVSEFDALPPIEGLAPFAIKQPPILDWGDWVDKYYHLWTADLENVDAKNVREIWVDDIRYAGLAGIQGRFFLKPLRRLEVGPITMTMTEGTLGRGMKEMAHALAGRFDVTIAPLDPRYTGGSGFVHRTTLSTGLRLTWQALGAFIEVPWLGLDLNHGVLMDGTHVSATGIVHRPEERFAGALVLDGRDLHAAGSFDGHDFDLTRVRIAAKLAGLVAGDPVRALEGQVEATGRGVLGKWRLGGDADAGLRLSIWEFVPTDFVIERLRGRISDVKLRGPDVEASAKRIDASGRRIAAVGGKVELAELKVALDSGQGHLGSRFFAVPRVNLDATMPHFPSLRSADLALVVDQATLDDVTGLRVFLPSLPVDRGRAQMSGRVDLSASKKTASGTMELVVAAWGLKAAGGPLNGNLRVRVTPRAFDGETLDLSGSQVALTDVIVGVHPGWKGVAQLTSARASFGAKPGLDARLELVATDATPLQSLLADKVPTVALALFRMPDLRGRADLSFGPDKTDIEHIDVRGGNVEMTGGLHFGKKKDGEIVVKKGAIPVNLRLDDSGMHVTPFKGSTDAPR